jgi:tetratricopeptide (TPR) repeat protein
LKTLPRARILAVRIDGMDEISNVQLSSKLQEEPTLSRRERVLLRCRLAKELEDTGDYESARELLSPFWRRVGERPDVADLDEETVAELLLRSGTLTGWLGNLKQAGGAQEVAKDLIGESLSRFGQQGRVLRAAEAQTELAFCYWREGAFDEARVLLQQVIEGLEEDGGELRLVALLRKALVESSATRFSDSLRILLDAASLFEASNNHALKGRFHNELAYNFQSLGSSENRADYTDRALVEFTAASFHFELAGHTRYRSRVENNLGLLFYTLGRLAEAHEHLDRARASYSGPKNTIDAASVDETRARVFLAQGLFSRAEETAEGACGVFETAGEFALLAEAMTTKGAALARLGRAAEAQQTLERAAEIAEQAGNVENAGMALLTLMEELPAQLSVEELRASYQRADALLARSQHPETLVRLRQSARQVLDAQTQSSESSLSFSASSASSASANAADTHQSASVNENTADALNDQEQISAVQSLVAEAQRRRHKEVTFSAEALNAMGRLFLKDGMKTLAALVDETIAAAPPDALITPDAVEIVALRGRDSRGNFAQPWADFSLKDELRQPEKRFIELALKAAEGKISIAARLLGFNHNELLTSIIKSRYPDLLAARTPTIPRRRSIIRKPQPRKR